ncbi:MAG: phage Gp37/Gp68 family protein [Anaerolineae bacterium]|nr:phage Gp37/Gp68 family protein [Anaerolineae bacterium]
MGENTGISWTDHTFNPWWGCQKVSEGCKNCYAEHLANHRLHMSVFGPVATTRRKGMSENYWEQPFKWNKAAPAGLGVIRKRVFCASMADVFEDHPQVEEWRERLWAVIEVTPNLDWLLLTKRPENIEAMLPDRWIFGSGTPKNIWLGASAENQDHLDSRWPVLQSIGRTWGIRYLFLSLEPLLGPINLEVAYEYHEHDEDGHNWRCGVDWVIVGGESGFNARPMNLGWARAVRDQCVENEIPFFFKQVGGKDKKKGGDVLDGQVWHQFPWKVTEPQTTTTQLEMLL